MKNKVNSETENRLNIQNNVVVVSHNKILSVNESYVTEASFFCSFPDEIH